MEGLSRAFDHQDEHFEVKSESVRPALRVVPDFKGNPIEAEQLDFSPVLGPDAHLLEKDLEVNARLRLARVIDREREAKEAFRAEEVQANARALRVLPDCHVDQLFIHFPKRTSADIKLLDTKRQEVFRQLEIEDNRSRIEALTKRKLVS